MNRRAIGNSLSNVMKTSISKVTGERLGDGYSYDDGKNYAGIRTTRSDSLVRRGQFNGNTNVTAPGFYTPFTTASSFQIPNNRKEIYIWADWWVKNEPKVAAGIEFYTDFPLSGFKL